jgi:hypothetical protein
MLESSNKDELEASIAVLAGAGAGAGAQQRAGSSSKEECLTEIPCGVV